MQKKALIAGVLLLLSVLAAFADVAIEPVVPKKLVNRGGSTCASYAHISGFGQYKNRQFYLVETIRDGSVLAIARITGDSITVDEKEYSLKPGVVAAKYLSWDPDLAGLKYGQEYKRRDVAVDLPDPDRQGIDYGRSQRKSIEIPVLDYIGFERIDSFYGLQWFDSEEHSFRSEFELEWQAQVWKHPQFTIRGEAEAANWYDISSFLDDLTRSENNTYEFWEMQKDDLKALLAFVPEQSGWKLELRDPLDKIKVYYHKGTSAQNYSIPVRIPVAYRVMAFVLAGLVLAAVLMLFYKVVFKGSGSGD